MSEHYARDSIGEYIIHQGQKLYLLGRSKPSSETIVWGDPQYPTRYCEKNDKGVSHGVFCGYYSNKALHHYGTYYNGNKHGLYLVWYDNGKPERKSMYNHGKRTWVEYYDR